MNKKKWIIAVIIIAVIIGMIVFNHYVPLWFNLTSLVFIIIGIFIGFLLMYLYNKLFKKSDNESIN